MGLLRTRIYSTEERLRERSEPDAASGASLGDPLRRLFEPVDIASLVFFRVAFGAIMLWEVWRYYEYGWIEAY